MQGAIAVMGIHTGIGKTIVSAIITEALQADYWKPVQAGSLDETDSMLVGSLVSNMNTRVLDEVFRLTQPMSPHAAARIDGINIELKNIVLPATDNFLVVETAGGIHSPLNDDATMIDLVTHLKLPCVLVVQHYLGSINHSLMSIEIMQKRNVQLKGIVINGDSNKASEDFITSYAKVPILAHIPNIENINSKTINKIAAENMAALRLLK